MEACFLGKQNQTIYQILLAVEKGSNYSWDIFLNNLSKQAGYVSVISNLKVLEGNGLILSEESKEDKRKKIITLTPKGKEILGYLKQIYALVSNGKNNKK